MKAVDSFGGDAGAGGFGIVSGMKRIGAIAAAALAVTALFFASTAAATPARTPSCAYKNGKMMLVLSGKNSYLRTGCASVNRDWHGTRYYGSFGTKRCTFMGFAPDNSKLFIRFYTRVPVGTFCQQLRPAMADSGFILIRE